MSVSQHWSR